MMEETVAERERERERWRWGVPMVRDMEKGDIESKRQGKKT